VRVVVHGGEDLVARHRHAEQPAERLDHLEHGQAPLAALPVREHPGLLRQHGFERGGGELRVEVRLGVVRHPPIELLDHEEGGLGISASSSAIWRST
jgi:hypothetical protein